MNLWLVAKRYAGGTLVLLVVLAMIAWWFEPPRIQYLVDELTGCQYVVGPTGTTPRLHRNGKPYCKRAVR